MEPTLRVALLSHLASRGAPTGAERSLAELARGLLTRGHQVTVVAPGPWVLADELRTAGVEVRTIPTRACWLTYWEARPWPLVAARWLRYAWPQRGSSTITHYLRDWRADVAHVNCLPHLRGAGAVQRAGVPFAWHIREILPPGTRRRWWAGHLRRTGAPLVAVSQAVATWLREEGLGAQTAVVHNGIRVPAAAPDSRAARHTLKLPGDGILLGLVGQLVSHKGALLFVRAAAAAMAGAPTLHAVLAGSGPAAFRAEVERAIAATATAERFHMLPPQPEGRAVIAACDLLCVPTLTPDPLPRVVMEAMAAGRPVVAFATGGIPEMVVAERTGLLVPPGDEAALSGAILTLVRDPERRAAMGVAARERCRDRFALDRHLDRMEEVLRSLRR